MQRTFFLGERAQIGEDLFLQSWQLGLVHLVTP